MQIRNLKTRFFLGFLGFLISLVLLDRVLLGWLYFQFPNELEWDTSPWYNFLENNERIQFSKSESSVLIAGSSVALYSTLPKVIDSELESYGISHPHTEYLAHPAMSTTDFYYYLDIIKKKHPKVVFYPINLVDFQPDFLEKLPEGSQYREDLRQDAYLHRHPTRFFYPGEFLWDEYTRMSRKYIFQFLAKWFLLANRYRSFWLDPFDAYLERHTRSMRSYHYYTGKKPIEGIWLRGWTPMDFHIDCELTESNFSDQFFVQSPLIQLRVSWKIDGNEHLVYLRNLPKKGWYPLNLGFPAGTDTANLHFQVYPATSSDEVDSRLFGKEYKYGIRLSQNFCKRQLDQDISYERPEGKDDTRFAEMTPEEYLVDYTERIYGKNNLEGAMDRLSLLSENKIWLSESKEFFHWSEFQKLEAAARELEKEGIQLVLVNSPENPLEISKYRNSVWYKGMMDWYRDVAKKHHVIFYDRALFLEDPRGFMDAHHLSYESAETMSKEYARLLSIYFQEED